MPNLVGTGLNQVPTNSMLGGLAYQDPEHASIKNLDLKNLSQINSEIADTAVDVFVYDTSKDSDGGAWRKRTQSTSWYNETLNTATRGSRKEFPAVAVIVAETSKVTIYDGDDPDLPMWMIFKDGIGGSSSYTTFLGIASVPISSVLMLNGVLCVGFSSSAGWGVSEIGFVSDSQRWWWTAGIYKQPANTIDERNVGTVYVSVDTSASVQLVNAIVNDVAMTVLPNAPIDSTTGLPIPTIAVATNGGTSVIKDDGNVFDYTFSGQNGSKVWEITFDENHQVNMLLGYSNVYPYTCYQAPVPSADTALASNTNNRLLSNSTFNFLQNAYKADNTPGDLINHFIDSKYFGTTHGLSFLTPDRNNIGGQMLANITTEFNSGWMHGDIKGAFLSDTDTTNVTGSNLMSGATYNASDRITSYSYTAGSDTLIIDDDGATADGYVSLILGGLSPSTKYVISYVTDNTYTPTTGYNPHIGNTSVGTSYFDSAQTGSGQGSMTFTTASSGNSTLVLYSNYSGGNLTYTINLRLAEEDRSVNNKGLQVLGTITKSAVDTGADLVAYSGFSGTNVLRQPPNSDMNLGTSDAYIMTWYKTIVTSGTMMLISYEGGVNGTTDYGKPFNIRFHNGTIGGWASHNNFSTYDNVYDTTSTADGVWHCVAWVRRSAVFELYVDGRFAGSDTGAVGSNALSDANSELVIGARKRGKAPGSTSHEEPFTGFLALAKIGKTAPSADQILKIYEDEKVLFQEGAQATLYGSSDAVTALAYDEDTSLLHVGTASGRSDFSGLKRVENTTTAVATAISASNGLVAEQ